MIRAISLLALIASAAGFMPSMNRIVARQQMAMSAESIQTKISKAVAVATIGAALFAPISPVIADGATSASSVYRTRVLYGQRILDLEKAANSGDFGAFADKKAVNGFGLFISGTNPTPGKASKEKKAAEQKIVDEIYKAVESKDASKLKSAYSEFVNFAALKSPFGPNDIGQTDSSGYSPTWGTPKQQIYQR
mmetsp:Transcript_19767/g.19878  ORF Transcript_19767/g.19878 Transcript_19767/m.19878 type:complete len:193 (+) Transcript_19767:89-667(+)|eukprot:CAMPEP_0182417562 /NCGR_PEP_ID=MMETSP1167-20130531/2034_1 /TAXON_ID=2988 /ORGANISM="Mallomonas Sp, Strain CCMP3275" /LENGTH=192 /DNA_ID=CAMNT_0024591221 /DNA_START=81 /DNA_END=659 /DNA_ORIENTATION=-